MANRKKKQEAREKEKQRQAEIALKRQIRNRYIMFSALGVALAILVGIIIAVVMNANKVQEIHTYTGGEVVKIETEIDGKASGEIYIELLPEYAPKTVENFKKLAKSGFYDGLTFHRVIPDFMVQGGVPDGNGEGGSPDKIVGEFSSNGHKNDLKHTPGIVSMARANDPNSASSQFFICTEVADWLDGDYAAFGKVVRGIKTVYTLESYGSSSGQTSRTLKMSRVTFLTAEEAAALLG